MPTKSASDQVAATAGQRNAAKTSTAGKVPISPYRGWVLLGLAVLAVAFWIGIGYAVWTLVHSSP